MRCSEYQEKQAVWHDVIIMSNGEFTNAVIIIIIIIIIILIIIILLLLLLLLFFFLFLYKK